MGLAQVAVPCKALLRDFRLHPKRTNPRPDSTGETVLLETPLKFTPTPDHHYVIEGPAYLGALFPIESDPSGIRTRVRGLKGHCPGPD